LKKSRKVTGLENRIFIDKRPIVIEKRVRVGDLEGDFIVSGRSGNGILLVAVCRSSRVALLELILDVSINEVHRAFARIKERFPEMRTLTLDNDILFKKHIVLGKLLKVKIYFCHPYHSWEKGGVENANMEIRKFIPKSSDLSQYDQEFIQSIEKHLNGRFMQCLNYKTPEEKLRLYRANKKQPARLLKEKY
jgi:IS30 family transposase